MVRVRRVLPVGTKVDVLFDFQRLLPSAPLFPMDIIPPTGDLIMESLSKKFLPPLIMDMFSIQSFSTFKIFLPYKCRKTGGIQAYQISVQMLV